MAGRPSRGAPLPARRIDLHTHSTASDGTTPPADLVARAAAAGLDVVALTDHDTTAGLAEAAAALPAGLTLVPGAELSCRAGGISLHLLAYLFDPAEPGFAAARARLRESRVGRAEAMVASLAAAGTRVTWSQVHELAGGTVGRPHIAQALVDIGAVGELADAFVPEWIGTGGRHWVGKLELPVGEALGLVRAAGGVAVFAHPGAHARGATVGDDVVEQLAADGLAGLEVDHPDHDADTRRHLRRLAAGLGLLVTGSSDFHGERRPAPLGAFTTEGAVYDELVARATGAVPVAA